MRILNFGSLNVDHVYRVGRIVRPGETIATRSYDCFAGGKGANQSVALARAGADVAHAGCIGRGAQWLVEKLADAGVDITLIRELDEPTGQAVIQVDDAGENAIFLFAGTNHCVTREQIAQTLAGFGEGDLLLVQNEINDVGAIITAAAGKGMGVCLNPAPFTPDVLDLPLDRIDWLIVNETEAQGVAGSVIDAPEALIDDLAARLPRARIVCTLGAHGVIYRDAEQSLHVPAKKVEAVDTTAAGDCFIGYLLAGVAEGLAIEDSLGRACAAAAVCVSRMGAMDSIPAADEVRR
jgi:ribokinase